MTTTGLARLDEAVRTGKRKDARALTEELLAAEVAPQEILDALSAGMEDVGRRFKANEIYVPEVLVAARAMQTSMDLLRPSLIASGIAPEHTVVIGTVQGDLHDIGKNLVAMMLEGGGFEVVDLGTNVAPAAFAAAARERGADLVALSALLTTTMPAMRTTIQALRAGGIESRIVVGGAPVTQAWADQIGADGYAPDAASAVDLARGLVAVG